jgi:ankyrin repeat protein
MNIFAAAEVGDESQVAALLDRDPALLETVSPAGCTPLQWAAKHGRLGVVRLLVQQRGATVNSVPGGTTSALAYAFNGRHGEVVALPSAERVNRPDRYGTTALHHAVDGGHGDVATFLLDHGASADTVDRYGETLLMMACSKGLLGVVQRAVQQLPVERVNHQDHFGKTALHCAASRPNGQVAALLLAHGASTNTLTGSATTPLMTACYYGRLDAVRLLLPHMTTERVNHQDKDGKTALHHAVRQRHGDVGVFLLEHGALVDTVDTNGMTPLMTACSNGLLGVVQRAVQQLPAERVNHPDRYGMTALHHAVGGKHGDVGAFLLDHGASADTVDANGTTPLLRACSYGLLGVVQRAVQQLPA